QAVISGEPVERPREIARVEWVEPQPCDTVLDRLGEAAEPRHENRNARRETLECRERRAVPPHRRQRDEVDLPQELGDLAWGELAGEFDDPTPVELGERLREGRRNLPMDQHPELRFDLLSSLDQQLRALVRKRRAEKRDGQLIAGAAGAAI